MPHLRLNSKTVVPNPYFNFISALPSLLHTSDTPGQENAKEILDALAAQVRPICKKHGFTVNSFEEYEYNNVFLGRNWNAGETIEIVLRHSNGRFHSSQQLVQVLCHELAHIKHMNHGAGFQQLNIQLCHEVAALRSKGYYGDGLYSSGSRLADSAEVAGHGLGETTFDLPEYMCGGAQQRQRASTLQRRPRQSGPRAGTAKRRKPGVRLSSKYAFVGNGQALNSHILDETEKKKGAGFRKSTQSAKERQARLDATEKRLNALQQPNPASSESTDNAIPHEDSDPEPDGYEETDESRRKLLSTAGAGWKFDSALEMQSNTNWDDNDIINLISDDEQAEPKAADWNVAGSSSGARCSGPSSGTSKDDKDTPQLTSMVRKEIKHHKWERLGLVGERQLGGANPPQAKSRLLELDATRSANRESDSTGRNMSLQPMQDESLDEWACLVCTCLNHNDYGACQACATGRGSSNIRRNLH